MDAREQQIKNLLWKEVASKSSSAAIAFSVFATIIYFYHFDLIEFKQVVQLSCISVVVINCVRFWVSRKITQGNEVTPECLNILRLTIWLNTIAWSIIFASGTHELNSDGFHFVILVTIMTGFLAASIVTLAYDKTIFAPYQLITLLPVMLIAWLQYYRNENPVAHFLTLNYFIFLLYQFRQYRDYRDQLIQRFTYQIDLEDSFVELKKSQSTLIEQTSQLIHASKISALGEMAGGLAHEINNSLMIILGSTQQVQRELTKSEKITPEIKAKFEQSATAIMKIKTVIEGLKYFSMQMGPQPKENTQLKEIVERTLSYTSELLKAHQATFTIDKIPDLEIYCHPFQITQVLFNLIKNADDAISNCPPGGHWIDLKFKIDGECILIKVVNGGTLVPEGNLQKLFQPFFTTKEVGQGTGLSLSISKGIARDHKGDLYLERDTFTTFVLKLPIA